MEHGDQDLDVAVVGGGISGLYTAWRLLTEAAAEGRPMKVAVFEASGRLGGRLLSVTPPGIPNTRLELGGMRFTSDHKRVCALVDRFQLERDDFPVSQPENVAYLRGRLLRKQDLADPSLVPYNFAPDERDESVMRDGFTLLAVDRVLRTILGKDRAFDPETWPGIAAERTYEGKRLWDVSLEYALRRSISQEAFRFAQDTGGYDTILHTWSVADGLPWNLADFGHTPQFYHLHRGFDALPDAIGARVVKAGGDIRKGHKLAHFEVEGASDHEDHEDHEDHAGSPGTGGRDASWVSLRFAENPKDRTTPPPVRARRLVLALPRRSLELLDPVRLLWGAQEPRVRKLIESVEPIPLFKLALCYSYPWWTTLDPALVERNGAAVPTQITKGQSITDIPLRQCYYWATDEASQNSVLLIYDDGTDLDFWAALRDRKEDDSFSCDGVVPEMSPASPEWIEHDAPGLMVDEAHRQLLIMHGVTDRVDIPEPYSAAYRDWSGGLYGGGVHFWHQGVKSHDVSEQILQPDPAKPVYVCGEAYSHVQGWVEGALETADAMLQRHFGIAPPGLRPDGLDAEAR